MGSAGQTNLGIGVNPADAVSGIRDIESAFAASMAKMNAMLNSFQGNLATAFKPGQNVSINANTGKVTSSQSFSGVEDVGGVATQYKGRLTSVYDPAREAAAEAARQQAMMSSMGRSPNDMSSMGAYNPSLGASALEARINPSESFQGLEQAVLARQGALAITEQQLAMSARLEAQEISVNQALVAQIASRQQQALDESGRAPGDLGGVRDNNYINNRLAGDPQSQQKAAIAEAERQLQISAQQEKNEVALNQELTKGIALRQQAATAAQAAQEQTAASIGRNNGGLDPISGRIAGAANGGAENIALAGAQAEAQLNENLRAGIATKQAAASQAKVLADAEEQAALSGMNHGQKVAYFRQQMEAAIPRSKEYFDAQTKMNQAAAQGERSFGGLGNMFKHMVIGFVAFKALEIVTTAISAVIDAEKQYSVETARFAAVTQQSIGVAIEQYNALRDAASQRGFMPSETGPAIQSTARFTKSPEGQMQLMEAGTKLAEFMGASDPSAVITKLGESVVATGGDFSTSAQKAEMLASAFVKSGSSANQFLDTLSDAASISEKVGLSYEKTVMAIVAAATASGQTASTSFQAFNRIADTLGNLSQDKLTRVVSGFRDLGINALDASKKMLPAGDIIAEIGSKFSGMSLEDQSQSIELLFGGEKVKGNIRAAGAGLVKAWSQGMMDELKNAPSVLEPGLAKIENTFGKTIDRIKAMAESRRQEGDIFGSSVIDTASSVNAFLGSMFGGAEGGRRAAQQSEVNFTVQTLGPEEGFRKSKDRALSSMQGLPEEEAKKLAEEYNSVVEDIGHVLILNGDLVNSAKITFDEIAAIADKSGADSGKGFLANFLGITKMQGVIGDAIKKMTAVKPGSAVDDLSPESNIIMKIRNAQDTGGAVGLFPTQELDLTKYSVDEINQARMSSLQIEQQQIEALRAELQLLGFQGPELDRIVEARKTELETVIRLVRTQQGVKYETGPGSAFLQDALSKQDSAKKEQESNFQFKRYKDFDPAQFGQLQSLTQMYDAMLTKMGSPEKSQNINLLLGENNVFKTMTARLTALQMAMEDLTKVEKAQLSGTWNMPAGATAMVPITSLDIQRWNKADGGGFDPAAMAALLGLGGKTQESGERVASAVDKSASYIVSAIEGQRGREGTNQKGGTPKYVEVPGTPAGEGEEGAGGRGKKTSSGAGYTPMPAELTRTWQALLGLSRVAPQADGMMSKDSGATPGKPVTPTVNVSMMPVKATFNANLSVMMNGAVVARALLPILYDMLIRQARSTGISPTGAQR